MKISIIINNYNYGQYLSACVDSVLNQAYPDFEVIVVDDGSTDESLAIIESYSTKIIPVLKSNGGQASSLNAGFAKSTGEVICFLDADDAFLPKKLEIIASVYVSQTVDWCFDRVTTDEHAKTADMIQLAPFDGRKAIRRGRFPSLPVPTSGLSFRRSAISQILPMPEAEGVVISDNYIKFAATYIGRGVIINTPLTFQRIHPLNRYTGNLQNSGLKFRIMVATGLALAQRYPELRKISSSLIAGGIAQSSLKGKELWTELKRVTCNAANPRIAVWNLWLRVVLKRLRYYSKQKDLYFFCKRQTSTARTPRRTRRRALGGR